MQSSYVFKKKRRRHFGEQVCHIFQNRITSTYGYTDFPCFLSLSTLLFLIVEDTTLVYSTINTMTSLHP